MGYPKDLDEYETEALVLELQRRLCAAGDGHKIFWQLAAENLQRVLGKPDCEWKKEVHAIFTRKPKSSDQRPTTSTRKTMLQEQIEKYRKEKQDRTGKCQRQFEKLREALQELETLEARPSMNGGTSMLWVRAGNKKVRIYSDGYNWSVHLPKVTAGPYVQVFESTGLEEICEYLAKFIVDSEPESEAPPPPKVPSSEDRGRPVEGE